MILRSRYYFNVHRCQRLASEIQTNHLTSLLDEDYITIFHVNAATGCGRLQPVPTRSPFQVSGSASLAGAPIKQPFAVPKNAPRPIAIVGRKSRPPNQNLQKNPSFPFFASPRLCASPAFLAQKKHATSHERPFAKNQKPETIPSALPPAHALSPSKTPRRDFQKVPPPPHAPIPSAISPSSTNTRDKAAHTN